nr:trypsin-like peptidase domain-containing protein [uncultured Roseateles sp.]
MRRTWLIFTQAVTVALACLFVVATLKPDWLRRSPMQALQETYLPPANAPAPGLTAPGAAAPVPAMGFSVAAKRAAPAVVSVTASKAPTRNPQAEDPWFRFFFGDRAQQQQRQSAQVGLGSGVIVSPQGYLLTNNHVVAGASDIEVQLTDGRQARAELVGTDPETDVAVLKIALDKLPVISFGNVEVLQVGDAVLAIGNPFNVGQTVTAGIVSALGRSQLGINIFENFIQTDAAINPGNSGGALVDGAGNLVGINTAIYSRSGGSLGIGFAIPASTARQVMEALIKDGRVARGWIGVQTRDLTPEFVEAFKLPISEGVLISGVLVNAPAASAGIKPGDVVTRVAGTTVRTQAQLLNAVAALAPNAPAVISVQRADKALELRVQVAQRPRPQIEE